jgi:plastocyanin domain-containing protein
MVSIYLIIGLILVGLVVGWFLFKRAKKFNPIDDQKKIDIEIEKALVEKSIQDLEDGIKKIKPKERTPEEVEKYYKRYYGTEN